MLEEEALVEPRMTRGNPGENGWIGKGGHSKPGAAQVRALS
jgi:hypothetical protein